MPDQLSVRLLPDWVDPSAVFRMLEAQEQTIFWLDAGTDPQDGWSFIGTGETSALPADVRIDTSPSLDGHPPFRGGWVGWRDYESGARAAGAPITDDDDGEGEGDRDSEGEAIGDRDIDDRPSWIRATHVVAFDHARERLWVLAEPQMLEDWVATVARTPHAPDGAAADDPAPEPGVRHVALARHEPQRYAELIQNCRDLIRAGIAYQLCLTTRFTVPGRHDAVAAYRRLRASTPTHHGGFVRIGDRSLLSASPEQFLHVDGGVIRTRPIKGTRPRGDTPAHDAALAAELAVNVKERAENVMIVDLMRNDLSRVCVAGSIRVDGLWMVETYPAVHQLVSAVSGTAAAGTTVGALLAATFPAGSMTGAPKLSAMTRLHALEHGPRGIYAGCFGYVGVDGVVDLAMVIRSIVVDAERAVVGAGGGITWGSESASEVAEVATKAAAPLAALGAVLPVLWGSDILN